jgi:hypothetical protein
MTPFSLFLPLPSASDRRLKSMLIDELHREVSPLITSLGFLSYPKSRTGRGGFPTNYYRRLLNRIDVINFQWSKYGTPAFIINFDIILDMDKFTSPAKEVSDTWFIAPPYRARANTALVERWFKIGHLARLASARSAARTEVLKAKQRIVEIDEYARTGKSSQYFRNTREMEKMPDVKRE